MKRNKVGEKSKKRRKNVLLEWQDGKKPEINLERRKKTWMSNIEDLKDINKKEKYFFEFSVISCIKWTNSKSFSPSFSS